MRRRRNAGQDRLCGMAWHEAGFHLADEIAALGGGAHAVQQEVDMKRDDMGRDVLPPSRPARNPRLEKIFTPPAQLPGIPFQSSRQGS